MYEASARPSNTTWLCLTARCTQIHRNVKTSYNWLLEHSTQPLPWATDRAVELEIPKRRKSPILVQPQVCNEWYPTLFHPSSGPIPSLEKRHTQAGAQCPTTLAFWMHFSKIAFSITNDQQAAATPHRPSINATMKGCQSITPVTKVIG